MNRRMPRANRYILPGYIYHLTHRCHNREFLLRFAVHRKRYRDALRAAVGEFDVSLLDYCITSNHVHLLAFAEQERQISQLMKKAAGESGQGYNRRKGRSGAFWEGRFHSTMVDSGRYLLQCLVYIELNMVRCGVVEHPSRWEWSGYSELMGIRKRYRLLDVDRLLGLLGTEDAVSFRKNLNAALALAMEKQQLEREPRWTESLAVGSEAFVKEVQERVKRRRTVLKETGGAWMLQETPDWRGLNPEGKKVGWGNCMQGPILEWNPVDHLVE
jgi:putative transposase